MNKESASSILPPASSSLSSSSSSSSSFLAPAGRVAVKKQKEEEEPPVVVTSSSSSLKQEETAVKAEELNRERNIDDHNARCKNDWEPGNRCWLLGEDSANCNNSAAVVAVTSEAAGVKKEEEHAHHDVVSAPELISSLSSSQFPTGSSRSTKEEEHEEKYHHKLRRRDDEDVTEKANEMTFQAKTSEEQTPKSRHDNNNNTVDEDEDNNHKICHSTNRILKSNMNSDRGSVDNTITNTNWMAGSWCWMLPTTSCGSRSDVASLAVGSICRRSTKRKAAERLRESKLDEGRQHEKNTEQHKFSLDNSNNQNSVTDRQHHDPFYDDWTTSCWCWEPPNTDSAISGVPLVAASASIGRRKNQKRGTPSSESRYIVASKHHTNIGHHHSNNSTDFDKDTDTDDILEYCSDDHVDNDDDDNGTDSDRDWGEYDDGSASDNSRRGNGIVVTSEIARNSGGKVSNDSATTVFEKRWNKMYGRLVKYKKTYKSMTVTKKFDDKHNLQGWIYRQRFQYNRKQLCVDKINRLESIGFVWNTLDAQWTEKYERLVKYKKENKSTCVPDLYPGDPKLGQWVRHQRSNIYRTKNPSFTTRISQLDSIGFVWNPFDAQWTEKYDRLVKYKKEYKTTCVPLRYPADRSLGRWVQKQQFNYKNNKSRLTAERISRLDSIGFVWN